jgi:hypothetical protein
MIASRGLLGGRVAEIEPAPLSPSRGVLAHSRSGASRPPLSQIGASSPCVRAPFAPHPTRPRAGCERLRRGPATQGARVWSRRRRTSGRGHVRCWPPRPAGQASQKRMLHAPFSAKPTLPALVVRKDPLDPPPEFRAMTTLVEVHQLMHQDVVDDRRRQEDSGPVQVHIAARSARTPAKSRGLELEHHVGPDQSGGSSAKPFILATRGLGRCTSRQSAIVGGPACGDRAEGDRSSALGALLAHRPEADGSCVRGKRQTQHSAR